MRVATTWCRLAPIKSFEQSRNARPMSGRSPLQRPVMPELRALFMVVLDALYVGRLPPDVVTVGRRLRRGCGGGGVLDLVEHRNHEGGVRTGTLIVSGTVPAPVGSGRYVELPRSAFAGGVSMSQSTVVSAVRSLSRPAVTARSDPQHRGGNGTSASVTGLSCRMRSLCETLWPAR